MVYFKVPQKHKCGEIFEEKRVPVNEKVLGEKDYPICYCPKCDVYKMNEYESKNPGIIGDIITEAQAQTNLKHNKSIYAINHLEKMTKQLIHFKK